MPLCLSLFLPQYVMSLHLNPSDCSLRVPPYPVARSSVHGDRHLFCNFGVLLANEAAAENRRKKRRPGNKHQYSIDFTTSIKTARKFFCHKPSEKQIDVIRLLGRFDHAIKEDFRHFDRHLRSIGAIRFSYR